MSHHTWVVKKRDGPAKLTMFVGETKLAIAGVARLRERQETWIEPVLDIELTSKRAEDLDFIQGAVVNDSFGMGIRGMSISESEKAPIHIQIEQNGTIVPARGKNGDIINESEDPNHPYTSILILKAPEMKEGGTFGHETFGVFVKS